MSSTRARIDVCVATYKRPDLLKKLLQSLIAQETGEEFSFTIIVADNDSGRSGETVVRDFNRNGRTVLYDVEPEQNISLTRNKSLSHATGDYIATIDDDIHADPLWLLSLYRTLKRYNADVVHGPVFPEFHPKTPKYIKESGIFMRPNPETGSSEYTFTAANSLFARHLIEGVAMPFDPQFGKTGGEDAVFFGNLKNRGCKYVWCREAKVFSLIPPNKTNLRWITQREFRIGNGYFRVFDQASAHLNLPPEGRFAVLIRRAAKAGYPIPFYALRGLFDVRYTVKALERLRPFAFYTGIIAYFLGVQYEEYRAR